MAKTNGSLSTQKLQGKFQHVELERCGYPERAAAGLTHDKSQGQTFDCGVVDLSKCWVSRKDSKDPGKSAAAYVALSRFRTLDSFVLLGMPWEKAYLPEKCREEIMRLRNECKPDGWDELCAYVCTKLATEEGKLELIEEVMRDTHDASWLTGDAEDSETLPDAIMLKWNEQKNTFEQECPGKIRSNAEQFRCVQ